MSDDQFTPTEQALIRRLQAAPQRHLSPRTLDAIRQKILVELDHPASFTPQRTNSTLLSVRFVLALAAAVTLIAVIGLLLRYSSQSESSGVSPASPTQVAIVNTVVPTESATPVNTAPPTEVTPSAAVPTIRAVITNATEPAPQATHTPASPAETVVVIEGPVQSFDNTSITIFDVSIQVTPGHPILNMISVGDTVRVEGVLTEDNMLTATVIDNILNGETGDATVGLDGPIEVIEENTITINSIEVVLDPADPILQTLSIGDFLSVEGNFEIRDNEYVLVVVTREIITPATIGAPPNCYYHDTGMGMGHWHCDGMGAMGMGGMEAMGMGN